MKKRRKKGISVDCIIHMLVIYCVKKEIEKDEVIK